MALVSAVLAVAILLSSASARAATVTGSSRVEGGVKGPEFPVLDLSVRGDPGERSALTVTLSAGGRVEVVDAAAPLVAAGSCTQASASAVVCSGPSTLGRFSAELGDGDDRLGFVTPGVAFTSIIAAGPGADEINGGPSFDAIDGGGGPDVLRSGVGGDSLSDGDSSGSADADVLDGGPGDDALSYAQRSGALAIDLPAGRAGEAGEDDRLAGIERVTGGAGPDVITGTASNDGLDGGSGGPDVITAGAGSDSIGLGGGGRADAGAGNDVIGGGFGEGVRERRDGHDRVAGGAGNDRLVDSTETDRYDAGPGRDLVLALDGRADRVSCGPGRDRLVGDRRERARGCERRTVGAHVRFTGSRRLEFTGRRLGFDLECPTYALGSCRGRLEARAGGEVVGRVRYRGTETVSGDIRLTAAARRRVRSAGSVTVVARGGDATGAIHVTRRQFRLRRG